MNLLITMVLGGLWHGAAVRFVLWGAWHGVALAIHKVWSIIAPESDIVWSTPYKVRRIVGAIITFHFVAFGWLLFRAESMAVVREMLSQIFGGFDGGEIIEVTEGYSTLFALMALGYVMHFVPSSWSDRVRGVVTRSPLVVQVVMMVVMIWLVMQVKSSDIQPFIYFQF